MKQFVAETESILMNQKTLSKNRVLCSFSGGQDSTIAFFVLFHRKRLSCQTINLLYFHHFWQIQNFQASKGIFHLSFNLKVPYTLILSNLSLENENRSRNWRRKKLFKFYNLQHSSLVVTGHSHTDRVETNLNNLIRGTSPKGVSSLKNFGGFPEASFNTPQYFTNSCFCSLVCSTSFVSFRLLTQPQQRKFVNKSKVRSKIFFSPNNSGFEKSISLFLQGKFVRKSRLTNEKSPSFNQHKWQIIFCKKKLRCHPKDIFLGSRLEESQKKSTNLWFWEQKKIGLTQNVQNNNFFSIFYHNRNSIINSNSFCFSKFFERRIVNLKTPIKNETRVTVSKVAKIYSLPVFHDLTNFSYQSSRNKIRHIVFPVIGYLFQKKVDFSFTQFFSTLRYDTYEGDNTSQKFYFLLEFFSKPSFFYSKLVKNSENLSTPKTLFLISEILGDWGVFVNQTKMKSFESFLLLYVCRKSDRIFHPYIIKKIMRNYTEREISFYQITNIQSILKV